MALGITMEDDGEYESPLDKVRYAHKRTAKGWSYETSVTIHRMPGEDGRTWMARSKLALGQARTIAVEERDMRDRLDAQRGHDG